MSILGRSSTSLCSPLHFRMVNTSSRHVSKLMLYGSSISTSHPRFRNVFSHNVIPSTLKHHKQGTTVRYSSSFAESSFQDMMSFRRNQAKHSVIIEVSSRIDIPCISKLCKAYGDVKNMIAFVGGKSKLQIIAEFMHEESVQKLLSDCSLKSVNEVFPCHSRCLRFENHGKQGNPSMASDEVTELFFGVKNFVDKQPSSVSEMMMELYKNEKMCELSTRLRFLSGVFLQDILKGVFPGCVAFPFGSSANGFGKDSSDLDLMLRLFPEQFSRNPEIYFKTRHTKGNCHSLQRYAVNTIGDMLLTFAPGVYHVQKIKNARMPIVKYENQLLNLECDVSVNNMTAVYMTEILFYCGELDPRVRPLIYTVKKWARDSGITTEEAGTAITNFALTLLVIFFLQCRPVPVLPPLHKLLKLPDPDDYRVCAIEYINEQNPRKPKPAVKRQNTDSLDVLLQEFFRFLAVFPFKEQRISVLGGESGPKNGGYPIWIDYPMDESQNVSKNVSSEDLKDLCEAGLAALRNLENIKTDLRTTDLMSVLGVSRCSQGISDRIDVRTFLDLNSQSEEAITHVR